MDLSLVSNHNHVGKIQEKSGTQLQPYLPQVRQVKPHRAFDSQRHSQQYSDLSWEPQTYKLKIDRIRASTKNALCMDLICKRRRWRNYFSGDNAWSQTKVSEQICDFGVKSYLLLVLILYFL